MNTIELNNNPTLLQNFLSSLGWLIANEKVENLSSPGEGNMNVVIRVATNQRSFILKQSRAFVRKYPSVSAPIERINTECQWYRAIQNNESHDFTPSLLHYSSEHNLLMISDIGEAEDLSSLYPKKEISDPELEALMNALSVIHNSGIPNDFPSNLPLRQLNHQHIFVLPFMEDNGFQLDDVQSGLQELSLLYKNDEELKSVIAARGDQYLSKGDTLLHGDYYPGSWLKASDEIFVIDPEFSFIGMAEFDLGVMAAHLILITGDESYIPQVCDMYAKNCNYNLVGQYAGIEIMRRLIGLAQLPLDRTLEEKKQLLLLARELVLD